MTAADARHVIIGLCIAILAAGAIWAAAKAWRALCEGWREALRLGEDRAVVQLGRAGRQAKGRHSGPFPAVAERYDLPADTKDGWPEGWLRPAEPQMQPRQIGPLRNVGKWGPQR